MTAKQLSGYLFIYKWDKLLNVDKSVHQVHSSQPPGPWDRGMILQVFTDYLCTIESDHVKDFFGEIMVKS